MDLKQQLARLEKTLPSSTPAREQPKPCALERVLPGFLCKNDYGWCWQRRINFDLEYQHGSFRLETFLENDPEHLQLVAKSREPNHTALTELVFIDTETTGLSGGVGTIPFLVGVGYFTGHGLVMEQYFLRRFEEERPLLKECFRILDRVKSSNGALVSFNGRAYDLPLLSNRAVFHRLSDSSFQVQHIDILHAARRLWKKYLPDCSLNTLESKILRLSRRADVPGHLIPDMYFRYLRTADPRYVVPIFFHNQLDILSMVSILNLLLRFFDDLTPTETVGVDWLTLGKVYEAVRPHERTIRFYGDILKQPLPDQERKMALLHLADAHKKNRNYQAAIAAWEEALTCRGFVVEPYEELAKVCEHRMENCGKAKEYTMRALENVSTLEKLNGKHAYVNEKARLTWRLKRLNRKLDEKPV